ncbi:I78 family peptidase inhibitor [Sphingomonas sp. H39-1-10]|uniref:I78 family peptidase inhibitor n=1 Tax=Sphingomonas TaxID=13687 RepID=UPI00089166AA|nr:MULTISPECIES: I78 family peptidase inhibitor [Sphingomonas]MDF0488546.1 I78 family peptidase inhibitor [Sphingomonas pollutisoli]SDA11792.1 Peptidase inhibitor I78 family protein [Sphingomonas sp. NFR15]
MKRTLPTFVIAPALLAACAPVAHGDSPAPRQCRSEAAASLVGHIAPDDAQVRRRTGASTIRRIAPGDMVTQDFRPDRVTLTIAPDGKVVDARCG